MKRLALLALVLAGCASARAQSAPACPSLFTFAELGFAIASEDGLTVAPDGTAIWTKKPLEASRPARAWKAQLSPAQLSTLGKALADHHLCKLKSARNGIPDETQERVSSCALGCTVEMWHGEWTGSPDGKAILAAFDVVIDDVVKRGTP